MRGSRHRPAFVVLATIAALLAGCVRMPGGGAWDGLVCDGVPASVCQEHHDQALRAASAKSGDLVGFEMRCTASACTEQAGEASVRARYRNGETSEGHVGWMAAAPAPAGPAAPAPEPATDLPVAPTCVGVPPDWCHHLAASLLTDLGGSAAPVGIVVRCTGTCTASKGHGETRVTFADGTEQSSGWGYGGAVP